MFRSGRRGRGGRSHWQERQWDDAEREDWLSFLREQFGPHPESHWFFGGRRFHGGHFGEWGPYHANPFLSPLLSKGGGLLPLYVLHLLAEKPRYGSDLMKTLEKRTGGAWVSNPGAIYPLLNALEDAGLIEGEWEDPVKRSRRFYRLTEAGQRELKALKEAMSPMLHAAVEIWQQLIDDLYGTDALQGSETPENE